MSTMVEASQLEAKDGAKATDETAPAAVAIDDEAAKAKAEALKAAAEHVNEKVDSFDEIFRSNLVKPILGMIPASVSPNHITAFNILLKGPMLWLSWRQNEQPGASTHLAGRSARA